MASAIRTKGGTATVLCDDLLRVVLEYVEAMEQGFMVEHACWHAAVHALGMPANTPLVDAQFHRFAFPLAFPRPDNITAMLVRNSSHIRDQFPDVRHDYMSRRLWTWYDKSRLWLHEMYDYLIDYDCAEPWLNQDDSDYTAAFSACHYYREHLLPREPPNATGQHLSVNDLRD